MREQQRAWFKRQFRKERMTSQYHLTRLEIKFASPQNSATFYPIKYPKDIFIKYEWLNNEVSAFPVNYRL